MELANFASSRHGDIMLKQKKSGWKVDEITEIIPFLVKPKPQ